MTKYRISTLIFILFLTHIVYAETHGEDAQTVNSILDIAPLQVGCTEEEAKLTNTIDCDNARFLPACVKVSLSKNPVVTWRSFDFVRHKVVILKEDVPFNKRVLGSDMSFKSRERLPYKWRFNFSTGEFLHRRNDQETSVSLVNTGEGAYNIWCRYHFAVGMVMKLWVVP